MPQSFNLGLITVYPYGLLVGLGVAFVYLNSSKKAGNFGLTHKNFDQLFLFGLVFTLIGARFYHVFDEWQYYKKNIIDILFINNGGLGIFGAIMGAVLGISIFARIQKLPLLPIFNLIFPPFLFAQAIGRIGNLFNSEAYYSPAPFLYESILCLVAFLGFLLFRKKFSQNYGFAYYLTSYGLIRFLTEFLRRDTWMILNIHVAHLLSILMILFGVFLFRKKYS